MLAPNLGKQTKTNSSVHKIMCTLPHFRIFVKFENQLQNLIFHKVFDKGNSSTLDGKYCKLGLGSQVNSIQRREN